MHCPKCGAELKDGSQFCGKCGYKIDPTRQATSISNPTPTSPQKTNYAASVPTTSSSANIRNIIAAIGAAVTIIGFFMPWVKITATASGTSGIASTLSTLLGRHLASFDPTYNLFTIGNLGSTIDATIKTYSSSSSSAYTMVFGIMFLLAVIVAVLLIVGAIFLLTKNKTVVLRVAGILGVIASIGIAVFLYATSTASNSALHYIYTFEMMGCVLSVIGCLVAAICPQSSK